MYIRIYIDFKGFATRVHLWLEQLTKKRWIFFTHYYFYFKHIYVYEFLYKHFIIFVLYNHWVFFLPILCSHSYN